MDNTTLVLPECLETEHLVLRPYRVTDARAYFDVCLRNKQHLVPHEAENPVLGVETLEDAERLVRQFAELWAERQTFFLGAWEKATGGFVAQIYVGPVNWELPEFEIGYFVDVIHEGKGYVTEAVKVALEFCFTHLGAHRLRINCNELNTRSWKLAERCGFVREGHLRQTHNNTFLADGTPSGDYVYGLLRSEYGGRR
jgi:RimJ/RimL family protein N-acetyltransferase